MRFGPVRSSPPLTAEERRAIAAYPERNVRRIPAGEQAIDPYETKGWRDVAAAGRAKMRAKAAGSKSRVPSKSGVSLA